MLTNKELYVQNTLSFCINKLWILENFDSEGESANKTLVPNGCFNIAFINGQGVLARFDNHVIELKEHISEPFTYGIKWQTG